MTENKAKKSGLEFEVPEGWEVVKLKDVAKITSGSTPLRSNLEYHKGGTIPWVKTTDLNNGEITVTEERITPKALKETSLRLYPVGTVLVAMYGGFNQIGRTGILGIEATINQALSALSVKSDEVDPNFLISWLNAKVGEWKKLAGSSRKDPNITSKDVGDFPFFLIPLPEQRAIAHVLGTIDQAIQTTERLIAQKELRKKWLMQNLLTGKMRLKGFSGEWREVSLDELGTFFKGSGVSKSEIVEVGLPAVRYGELYTKHHFLISEITTFIDINSAESSRKIQKGDILFAGSGETIEEIGKCAAYIMNDTAYAGGDIIVFRPYNSDSVFLGYLLNSAPINSQKISMGKGHSVVHIYPKDISTIRISLPEFKEQTAIAKVLQTADQEINLLKTKAEKLREQKKGIMQVLLTGKVRLKID